MHEEANERYFEWMYKLVCGRQFHRDISYRKVLKYLHDTEFIWVIRRDSNRAQDGIDLRKRFVYDYTNDYFAESYLDGPCSVLEMMVALAVRCEEDMDDPQVGDRTSQWFWVMMKSLGLASMTDDRFDEERVSEIIDTFLYREYAPNGRGGLFTIRDCDDDLRDVEIWCQLCWYLDSIL